MHPSGASDNCAAPPPRPLGLHVAAATASSSVARGGGEVAVTSGRGETRLVAASELLPGKDDGKQLSGRGGDGGKWRGEAIAKYPPNNRKWATK